MKKIPKGWKILGIVLTSLIVLGIVCAVTLHTIVVRSTREAILTEEEAAELSPDCILVLGARVWDDGSPSAMLEDRLIVGVDLYQAGISDRLLMSGDHSRVDYDEVNAMKDYAKAAGVPSSHIFMDHAGFSTYESLYRARDIFGVKKVVIVSQGYHLYRAIYTARALGLEAWGVPSDLRNYPGMPYYEFREKIARIEYVLRCLRKPLPTYLGEPIPITGDGDLTND